MPQDAHRDSRVDVERGQQRGARLAGAMDGDPGYACGDDAAVEAAVVSTEIMTVLVAAIRSSMFPARRRMP
jgi:hypothetical protein